MVKHKRRVFLIILDGVGIGALPDAAQYGDQGSNSLLHCSEQVGGLPLPCLDRLGLGRIAERRGSVREQKPAAHFGIMQEASAGKDTLTGHWEMMGLIVRKPFPTFPKGLPSAILDAFEEKTGWKPLGGQAASGTEIIEALGREHLKSGRPIVYTSADSVFQIAAHLDRISLQDLYRICQETREVVNPYAIARVVARPFTGIPGRFLRTADRRDFALPPPEPTLLDVLHAHGVPVLGIGKIHDIFTGRGISRSLRTADNREGLSRLQEAVEQLPKGMAFINLNDFDTKYGHRRNPEGYAVALRELDHALLRLLESLQRGDLLLLTADHGCDPTYTGTDHTREFVPLLARARDCGSGSSLGVRTSFTDVAATLAEAFSVPWESPGESFFGSLQCG